jgi:hypothetical protein
MARLARSGKIQRLVVRRLCTLEISEVTAQTVGRKSGELRSGAARVAAFAFDHGVRAYQGKAVLVILD